MLLGQLLGNMTELYNSSLFHGKAPEKRCCFLYYVASGETKANEACKETIGEK